MADIDITQAEADSLIAMEKRCAKDRDHLFPAPGDRLSVDLISIDKRENFTLDIIRGQIKLTKVTFNNRARSAIMLMRLDLDGPPHRNPDGSEVPCPHLHIYRAGYADKWAIPAPPDRYSNVFDIFASCDAFMEQCNITDRANIQKGLFS